jgi:hypothetical protein
MPLSRAAVDVVDGKSMLRFCRLNTEPGQTFGFELAQEDNKHVIRHVKPDSPAGKIIRLKISLSDFVRFSFSSSWFT